MVLLRLLAFWGHQPDSLPAAIGLLEHRVTFVVRLEISRGVFWT